MRLLRLYMRLSFQLIFCCTVGLQVDQLLHIFPISLLKADTSGHVEYGLPCVAAMITHSTPPKVATSAHIIHGHVMSAHALQMSHYSCHVRSCINPLKTEFLINNT
jgi:hypothetical protein